MQEGYPTQNRINLKKYVRAGYDCRQLQSIYHALLHRIDVDVFLTPEISGQVIEEIIKASHMHIPLWEYLDQHMTWQQLRQIRLGLEKRLDVSWYCNSMYSWGQMREIRLGLEVGLSVESYASLQYTEKEMETRRQQLMRNAHTYAEGNAPGYFSFPEYTILIDASRMHAYLLPQRDCIHDSKEQILRSLTSAGVSDGIVYDNIAKICDGAPLDSKKIVVALGKKPVVGDSGYYEYFFNTNLPGKEKPVEALATEGSDDQASAEKNHIDYEQAQFFNLVKPGQILTTYHSAQAGTPGKTVTGCAIAGKSGKELSMHKGSGFRVDGGGKTYIAAFDGKVERQGDRLVVTPVLIMQSVTKQDGTIRFSGTIYVRGDVGVGARITAGGDIYIDGYARGAELNAGGDILIRKGYTSDGSGHIYAAGNIWGRSFENARIRAGKNLNAEVVRHSHVVAKNADALFEQMRAAEPESVTDAERADAGIETKMRDIPVNNESKSEGTGLDPSGVSGYRAELYIQRRELDQLQQIYDRELRHRNMSEGVVMNAGHYDRLSGIKKQIRAKKDEIHTLETTIKILQKHLRKEEIG